jgi:hypothetical protein
VTPADLAACLERAAETEASRRVAGVPAPPWVADVRALVAEVRRLRARLAEVEALRAEEQGRRLVAERPCPDCDRRGCELCGGTGWVAAGPHPVRVGDEDDGEP